MALIGSLRRLPGGAHDRRHSCALRLQLHGEYLLPRKRLGGRSPGEPRSPTRAKGRRSPGATSTSSSTARASRCSTRTQTIGTSSSPNSARRRPPLTQPRSRSPAPTRPPSGRRATRTRWATGWGTISSGGARSDTLREVNIDRIADSACGAPSSYGSDFHPETMVCAGEIAGGQDACQGDSGGPLGDSGRRRGVPADRRHELRQRLRLPNFPGVYGRVAEDPLCSALQRGFRVSPAST